MSPRDQAEPQPFTSSASSGRGHTLAGDLAILRHRWKLIVGVVVVTMIVLAALHEHKAKSYAATASVTFESSTPLDAALGIATAGSSEPQREADTQVLVAHSPAVAEAVRTELKLANTANELLGQVKVEAAPTADVLDFIATTANPERSAVLANAFAKQYIAFQAKGQLTGLATAQKQTQEQIAALPPTSTERLGLEQTLARLVSLRAVAGDGYSITGSATAPTGPTGSGLSETLVIGLLVGLGIALALVFLLESLDRRVKSIEEFERGYRLPALAAIPRPSVRTPLPEASGLLEPYRILRSALDFTAVTHRLDTLMVTSAMPGEGKTTVAVNLARVVALSGRRAILVELDLRRPVSLGTLELGSARGVTTALTGGAKLNQLLVQPFADVPNLKVLPSGALPHNPSELLGSQRVTDLLSELSAEASIVIIDVPPLNPVADAQVLLNSPAITAVILVARIDSTTYEQMNLARSILDNHSAQPVGIVVTGVRDAAIDSYGYGAYDTIGSTLDVKIEDPEARVVSSDQNGKAHPGSRRSGSSLGRISNS